MTIEAEIGKPTREETLWACSIINKVINDEKFLGQYSCNSIPAGEFIAEAIRFMKQKWQADRQRLEDDHKNIVAGMRGNIVELVKQLAEAKTEIDELKINLKLETAFGKDEHDELAEANNIIDKLEDCITMLKAQVDGQQKEIERLEVKNKRCTINKCPHLGEQKSVLTAQDVEKIIKEHQNPYPKDIFLWSNKEKLDFNRGRFNEFTHGVVERMREGLLKEVAEAREELEALAKKEGSVMEKCEICNSKRHTTSAHLEGEAEKIASQGK